MMFFRSKINNEKSVRHYDSNGFLYVDESPIMSTDSLEYLGSELTNSSKPVELCGVMVEPDEIYKVRVEEPELKKAAKSFELIPIVNGHQWLSGSGGDGDARDFQEGSTGERSEVKDGKLFLPLKFTGKEILKSISEGVEELSASYEHSLRRDDSGNADFIAFDLVGNHIALVEKGRCGSGVRVYNKKEVKKMVSKNGIALLVNGKKVDLDKFLEEEVAEGEHEESITENNSDVDKRDIIRQIMAISAKSSEDFAGGEEEREEAIAKLAEKLAYNKSDAETADNTFSENEVEVEIEGGEDEKDEKVCAQNSANLILALKSDFAKNEAEKRKAYNSAVALTGEDFNAIGMSVAEIYSHALGERGIKAQNKSVAELKAMVDVLKSVRVQNNFAPEIKKTDEIEINI